MHELGSMRVTQARCSEFPGASVEGFGAARTCSSHAESTESAELDFR
jgi:hypothetical protein